ncbi:restriction endonuclease subunit S [Sinomonas gamaensis]|uniref:restriction endonuclease subunit S n=1 Tax=Sinomonas gamaensis TaxID=2565624 RepID=UPI001107FF70|nr:restriction endonuclease subunit S [Sinomonas gamaensis]
MTSLPRAWRRRSLSDFILLQRGFDLPKTKRRPGPFRVLSSGESSGWHDEAPVKGPGFVVGRATNIGRPTWSDEDYWPLNTVLYAKNLFGNDMRFAYYWFLATDLSAYNSGSVQPMLNRNYIAHVAIDVPPLSEQQGIAATLAALDDKIKSNQRLIGLIPELIRARVNASLELRKESVPASSMARFVNGGAYTKDATGTGRMVIRIADLNSGPGPSTVYNDLDVPEEKTARPGDILMSWSGSLGVYRWARDEAIVNQHIFRVIPSGYPAWLVFDRVEAVIEIFQAIAKDKATTMGHIQRGHLDSTFVDLPTSDAIRQLDADLGPLWQRLLLSEQEVLKLVSLRDVLLPELLSGRLRVPEAERAVEEAFA